MLKRHVGVETQRVILMQGLMAANGAMGTDTPDVPTAQDGTPIPERGEPDTTEES